MSKPQPIAGHPDADDEANAPAGEAERAEIRERDKVYPQQRAAARPADEVLKRLLDRHPVP